MTYKVGRTLFALSLLAFGVHFFLHALTATIPAPGPPFAPGHPALLSAVAVALVGTGLCIGAGWHVRWASMLLAGVLALRTAVVYAPMFLANVRNPVPWTSGFELLAIAGLALSLADERETVVANWHMQLTGYGRWVFAISLVVFGVQHFIYGPFIANLIPAFIPAHLFLAYAVGVGFCAAAIAIATNTQARLAAMSLSLMFLIWVVVLHVPRALAAKNSGNEWTSTFVAVMMCGGALAIGAGAPLLRASSTSRRSETANGAPNAQRDSPGSSDGDSVFNTHSLRR